MKDRLLAIVVMAGALVYLVADWRMPAVVIGDPLGPKIFPALIGIGLFLSGFLLLLESRGARASAWSISSIQSCKFFSLVSSFMEGILAPSIVPSMPNFQDSLCAAHCARPGPWSRMRRHSGFFTLHIPVGENECRSEIRRYEDYATLGRSHPHDELR